LTWILFYVFVSIQLCTRKVLTENVEETSGKEKMNYKARIYHCYTVRIFYCRRIVFCYVHTVSTQHGVHSNLSPLCITTAIRPNTGLRITSPVFAVPVTPIPNTQAARGLTVEQSSQQALSCYIRSSVYTVHIVHTSAIPSLGFSENYLRFVS
jgi:hypothetical protein